MGTWEGRRGVSEAEKYKHVPIRIWVGDERCFGAIFPGSVPTSVPGVRIKCGKDLSLAERVNTVVHTRYGVAVFDCHLAELTVFNAES